MTEWWKTMCCSADFVHHRIKNEEDYNQLKKEVTMAKKKKAKKKKKKAKAKKKKKTKKRKTKKRK